MYPRTAPQFGGAVAGGVSASKQCVKGTVLHSLHERPEFVTCHEQAQAGDLVAVRVTNPDHVVIFGACLNAGLGCTRRHPLTHRSTPQPDRTPHRRSPATTRGPPSQASSATSPSFPTPLPGRHSCTSPYARS